MGRAKAIKATRETEPWRDPLVRVTPGEVIRIIRKNRKMTVRQLAKMSGLDPDQIRTMESSNRVGRLGCMAVAKALRVSPAVIMFPEFSSNDK